MFLPYPLRRTFLPILLGIPAMLPAQQLCNLNVYYASCDSVGLYVAAFFPFGAGSSCPSLVGTDILPGQGGITTMRLFYDISGVWPQMGCTTSNNIGMPLPAGTQTLQIQLFPISETDTLPVSSDTSLFVCTVGVPESESPSRLPFMLSADRILWSSDAFPPDRTMAAMDMAGAFVRRVKAGRGELPLNGLAPGAYLIHCLDCDGRTSVFRFVVGQR